MLSKRDLLLTITSRECRCTFGLDLLWMVGFPHRFAQTYTQSAQVSPSWGESHVAGEEWPVFSANYSGVESSFLYVFRWFSISFRISTSLQLLSVLFSGSVHFQLAC